MRLGNENVRPELRESGVPQRCLPHSRTDSPGTVTGRYLSPEPLLQSPMYVRRMAQSGMSVPTYAYAANNPLRYVDADGLRITWDQNDAALNRQVARLRRYCNRKGNLRPSRRTA